MADKSNDPEVSTNEVATTQETLDRMNPEEQAAAERLLDFLQKRKPSAPDFAKLGFKAGPGDFGLLFRNAEDKISFEGGQFAKGQELLFELLSGVSESDAVRILDRCVADGDGVFGSQPAPKELLKPLEAAAGRIYAEDNPEDEDGFEEEDKADA